jgi:ESCRT-I complex subunit VPS37
MEPIIGPRISQLALDRRKQINTLMIFNENVSEVVCDTQYRVDFRSGDRDVALVVDLAPGFPKERPRIRVVPEGLVHGWLDPNGSGVVTAAPGLINFTVHSDLGRVVQAIKRELEKHPLTPAPTTKADPVLKYREDGTCNGTRSSLPASQITSMTMAAGVTSAVPGLAQLTQDELKEMRDSDAACKIFCASIANPLLAAVDEELVKLREDISRIVDENRVIHTRLERSRTELLSCKEHVTASKDSVVALRNQVNAANATADVASVCARLQSAYLTDERESDRIAESFLEGGIDLEEFQKSYSETRTSYHFRRAKLDKLRRKK